MMVVKRFSSFVLRVGMLLTVIGLTCFAGIGGSHAQEAPTATARPVIPPTPVGEQLSWVLEKLNGEGDQLTEADVVTRFDAEFLRSFPTQLLLNVVQETAQTMAPITFTGFAYEPISTGAIALVTAGSGEHLAITITIDEAAPHKITRLELTNAPAPASATARRVSIGDRSLYLDCTGSGGPTVVMEGGLASDWAAVQPAVAARTRVCSYDRPDSPESHSDPTKERVAQDVVDDLHALLAASGEPGPYVLVGHSLGGLYVQLYAYEYPDDVAGLVLVDPTPEEFSAGLSDLLESLGTPVPAPTGDLSPQETSFQQMREARAAGHLRPMPLIVLTHGVADSPDERPAGWPIAAEEELWLKLHQEIADLVPNSRHIVVANSKHDIHQEQPQVVSQATIDVVTAVLDPSTWTATPTATPTS